MWPFTRKVDKNSIEYLRKLKEKLEKQAEERGIVDKSADVAREFGEFFESMWKYSKKFSDGILEITYKHDGIATSSHVSIWYHEKPVFVGGYAYGGVFGYIHSVTSYCPGEWEDILDLKFKEARALEKEREIMCIKQNFLGE